MGSHEAFVLFCEDVRDEVGNKLSLMGLLGPRMVIASAEPILNNVAICVLGRFSGADPIDAEIQFRFEPAVGVDFDVAPPPSMTVTLEPPDREEVWQTHTIGKFHRLPIHNGMKIHASFRCLGVEHSATLLIDHTAVPDATAS